jgi:D-threo-aldose 1-dehydrogenase
MARAALHFVAAHPVVVSVIPGGQNVDQTLQNARLLNEKIPAAFWADLKAKRLIHPDAPTPD